MIAPFSFHDLLLESTNSIRFILASFLLLIYFLRRNTSALLSKVDHPIYFTLFAYFLLNLFSTAWSFNSADTILASQRIFLGIVFFYFIQQEIIPRKTILISIQSILLISLTYFALELSSLKAFSQDQFYRIHNFFIHKNLFSSFLFLGFIFSLYSNSILEKKWRIISIINTIGALTAIALLQNRTVFIALFAALCIYFFNHSKKARLLIGSLILLAGLSILIGITTGKNNGKDKIEMLSLDSIEERIKLWDKTVQLIIENPVLGIGGNNWQYNYAKYSVNDVYMIHQNKTNFQKPHNDYLWVLSETGTLGFLIISIALVLILRQAIKGKSREKNLLWAGLFGYAVISFFSFPSERIIHLFLIISQISLLIADQAKESIENSINYNLKPFLIIGLGFNLILGSFQVYGQYHTRKLLEAKMNSNFTKMIEHGEAAKSIFYKSDPTSTPIASYLGFAYHSIGEDAKAFSNTKESYLLAPYDFEILSNYGSQLMKSGDYDKAKEILDEAYRINKYNDDIKVNLAVFYYNQKNYWEAYQWLKEIPNYQNKQAKILSKIIEKLSFNKLEVRG